MTGYEYLEHTGDLKFRALGGNLEEAFTNAALAMINYITDVETVHPEVVKVIDISAENLEALLYTWLEEFLVLLDSEFFLPHKITEVNITEINGGYELRGLIKGDENRGQYRVSAVKAATYNDMEIKKSKSGWEITAVVDI